MKVSGIGGAAGPGESRKTGKADKAAAGAFARHLSSGGAEAAEDAAVVDGAAAVGGVDALLATQGVGDSLEQEQRRRLVTYGASLLDRLDEIRHGLLLGSIPNERLIGLARLVREHKETAADPRLAAILGEIELRVEVELAKLSAKPAGT